MLQELDVLLSQEQHIRRSFSHVKKKLLAIESQLIEVTLKKERLNEELRLLRNSTVSQEITERQNDLERFRAVLPELMKKV